MSDVGEHKPSDPPVVQETGGTSVEVLREVRVRSTSWSGPLPAPADLQLFEEIVPGAADRILTLTEKQSEHRMDLERSVVSENLKQSKLGLIAGFVLSAMVIFGGIFLCARQRITLLSTKWIRKLEIPKVNYLTKP